MSNTIPKSAVLHQQTSRRGFLGLFTAAVGATVLGKNLGAQSALTFDDIHAAPNTSSKLLEGLAAFRFDLSAPGHEQDRQAAEYGMTLYAAAFTADSQRDFDALGHEIATRCTAFTTNVIQRRFINAVAAQMVEFRAARGYTGDPPPAGSTNIPPNYANRLDKLSNALLNPGPSVDVTRLNVHALELTSVIEGAPESFPAALLVEGLVAKYTHNTNAERGHVLKVVEQARSLEKEIPGEHYPLRPTAWLVMEAVARQ